MNDISLWQSVAGSLREAVRITIYLIFTYRLSMSSRSAHQGTDVMSLGKMGVAARPGGLLLGIRSLPKDRQVDLLLL